MREIEFRVWSERYKTYNYKHHHNILGNFYINQNGAIFSDHYNYVTPEPRWNKLIVEQYTGIKDKNDRKIYEGDIVSVYDGRYIGSINQHPSGEWKIIWVAPKGTVDSLYGYRNECEVIGNIHDNPELLEDRNN